MILQGYQAGETRTSIKRPRESDKGHSITSVSTTLTFTYRWVYEIQCQCGKKFASRTSRESLFYRHEAHVRFQPR